MKKILVINDNSKPHGGADKVAIDHHKIFHDHTGFEVIFVSADDEAIGRYDFRWYNVIKNIFHLRVFFHLRSVISNFNPDIIFIHSWTKQLSSSIFLSTIGRDVRVIAHDYFIACPNGGLYNYRKKEKCHLTGGSFKCVVQNCDKNSYLEKILRLIRFQIQSFLIRLNTVQVYCLNEFQKELFVSRFFVKSYRNGIGDLKETYGTTSSYAYIGRSDPEKGVSIFNHSDFAVDRELIVFGPKNFNVSEGVNVSFYGWVERHIMEGFYPRIRAAIFPSLWYEVDPLTPWELMSRGIPVVAATDNLFGERLLSLLPDLVFSSARDLTLILKKLDDDCFYETIRKKAFNIAADEKKLRDDANKIFLADICSE